MQDMPKEKIKKKGPGRPRDLVNIRKALVLRKEGISWRKIALALDKDPSQIVKWVKEADYLLS